MSEQLIQLLSSIQSAASLLSVVFLVSALVCALVVAALPRPWGHTIKVLGSIAVMGLCLAANSAFIYGIGVFIVATLVTDLEFLEKLAAIVWNRKDYWTYLIDRATPKELEAKRATDALEAGAKPTEAAQQLPPTATSTDGRNEDRTAQLEGLDFARYFEERVIQALRRGVPPFSGAVVEVAVRVQSARPSANRETRILDAVVRLDDACFVVEIKGYRKPTSLRTVVNQVHGLISTYRSALAERGETPEVKGVIVVPVPFIAASVLDGIVVLKFDDALGEFTNATEAGLSLGLLDP